jgi:hypothetical protein
MVQQFLPVAKCLEEIPLAENLFSVHRIDGQITWLSGAAPEFLAPLPEWSTTGPIGAPGVLRKA